MEGDVSNKTILVLVVLTVIISVLGTLVVLSEVNNVKVSPQVAQPVPNNQNGYVMLSISPNAPKMNTNGYVTLSIVDNKKV